MPGKKSKAKKAKAKKAAGKKKTIANSIGMLLVPISAGEFQMGSPDSDDQRFPDETQHLVKITKPFYLGVYEVTQEQYTAVMEENPSAFKGFQNPVNANWYGAVEFCRKLSDLSAEKAAGYVYRLPTEAEWEYACRAGTTTMYSFGDDESQLDNYAWYRGNSGCSPGILSAFPTFGGTTYPVGKKKPNPWGLYDMHGNVCEWCQDWYGPYGSKKVVTDPTGPARGAYRVLRGGAFDNARDSIRSAYRNTLHHLPGVRNAARPDDCSRNVGFRVAKTYP